MKEQCGADVPIEHVPYERAYRPGFEDLQRRVKELEDIRNKLKGLGYIS